MKKIIKSACTLVIILFAYSAFAQNNEKQSSDALNLPNAKMTGTDNSKQINPQNAFVVTTPEGMQKMKPAIPIKEADNPANASSPDDMAQPQPASLKSDKAKAPENAPEN